jgi:dihydrolipoyl dehydrogenase
MPDKTVNTEIVVMGAGPGGYAAAFLAADMGMAVVLIDPNENPGGVCLYRGCIPSKTFLNAARLIHEAAESERWGIVFPKPVIDIHKLRSFKNNVVSKLTQGLGRLSAQRKITYIQGLAQFKTEHELIVQTDTGDTISCVFKNAIIATGSTPTKPAGLWKESPHILDSKHALELADIPESLLVIGGGYIGLELGSVYATLGSKVTVAEITPNLLPGVDKDLVTILKRRLDPLFETIALKTRAHGFAIEKKGVQVTLTGPDNESETRLFNKVLVAVGRQPNAGHIGLANTGIKTDDKGFIEIDDQCRTAAAHVFAIGDVAGEPMLAHKASHQGRAAVEVISGEKTAFEPAAIPAVVFTDPEIAWAGLTEREARERGLDFQVSRFPWAASGRAIAIDRTDGLTKLIVETKTERILGLGIVGHGASEMIAEGVLAIEMGANVTDLKLCIHPHPTLTETIMETADLFFNTATHFYKPRRKK